MFDDEYVLEMYAEERTWE